MTGTFTEQDYFRMVLLEKVIHNRKNKQLWTQEKKKKKRNEKS